MSYELSCYFQIVKLCRVTYYSLALVYVSLHMVLELERACTYHVQLLYLFQSCVNIVVDFISPENATHCIQLNDEIRLLPTRHKAKRKVMEVNYPIRMSCNNLSLSF